jgi:hypothetical protein
MATELEVSVCESIAVGDLFRGREEAGVLT